MTYAYYVGMLVAQPEYPTYNDPSNAGVAFVQLAYGGKRVCILMPTGACVSISKELSSRLFGDVIFVSGQDIRKIDPEALDVSVNQVVSSESTYDIQHIRIHPSIGDTVAIAWVNGVFKGQVEDIAQVNGGTIWDAVSNRLKERS